MELASARTTGEPRWHAALVEEELAPGAGPVPALLSSTGRLWAWRADSGRIRLLPRHVPTSSATAAAIAPGGSALLIEDTAVHQDGRGPMLEQRYCAGVRHVDLVDFATTRLAHAPHPGWEWRLALAPSPDGVSVAVAEQWRPDEYYEIADRIAADDIPARVRALTGVPRYVTVTINDVAGRTSRTIATSEAILPEGVDTLALQWSPDGASLAMSTWTAATASVATVVLDPGTGSERYRVDGADLAGSLSWSPGSDRLLLDRSGHLVEHSVVDGTERPLPPLPQAGSSTRRPEPPGGGLHRVLGYADAERFFTVTHRGTVMTLSRLRVEDGTVEPLARWAGALDLYPQLASMPAGFWD